MFVIRCISYRVYYWSSLERKLELLDRKGEILQILNKLDHLEYMILFTLYCNDLTNDEAMDKVDIRNRNEFFKLVR